MPDDAIVEPVEHARLVRSNNARDSCCNTPPR